MGGLDLNSRATIHNQISPSIHKWFGNIHATHHKL